MTDRMAVEKLDKPCTDKFEHNSHPFLLIPLHNLSTPITIVCPGHKEKWRHD